VTSYTSQNSELEEYKRRLQALDNDDKFMPSLIREIQATYNMQAGQLQFVESIETGHIRFKTGFCCTFGLFSFVNEGETKYVVVSEDGKQALENMLEVVESSGGQEFDFSAGMNRFFHVFSDEQWKTQKGKYVKKKTTMRTQYEQTKVCQFPL
jgi:hypothetical protein